MDKQQIWGTFSVRDHVREGAFIPEVLMYDRLVVPTPPDRFSGEPEERAEAEHEWQRWIDNEWNPARQAQLLGILGELAVPVVWSRRWREQWQTVYGQRRQSVSERMARELAYQVTGDVLLKLTPAMAEGVVAVAPYDLLDELKKDLDIRKRRVTGADLERGAGLPGSALTALIGYKFLVPEDPDKDDFELLVHAVDVARNAGYRTARQALHHWLRRFRNKAGEIDKESIRQAVRDFGKHVDALRKAAAVNKLFGAARLGCFIGKTAAKLAAGRSDAVGAAAISVGEYAAGNGLKAPIDDYRALPQGALFIDAQNKLGLTGKGKRSPGRWRQFFADLGVS